MSSQAPVNGKATSATVDDVTTHFSSLAYDLITLAELQSKLLYADVREAGSRSALAAVSLGGMIVVGLGAATVALFGLAELLVELAHWNRAVSMLVVGGSALLIAATAGWVSIGWLRRISAVFSRSQQELHANLEFVKSLVEASNGASPKLEPRDRPRC